MKISEIIEGILAKDRRALARAITYIENDLPGNKEILKAIYNKTGNAHIIGLTGFPGVGKSTLMSKLTEEFRKRGKTVGIVAVDPSSPFTGGALLGDRLRMEGFDANKQLWVDPGVFFRSMSSRGRSGGLAAKTGDVVKLLDAYGFDIIFVETVGAGQSEVDVLKVADTVVVILMPETGDDVQLSKAGILEIADIFVVNKADLEGAEKTVRWLRSIISMNEEVVKALSSLTHADEHKVTSGEIFEKFKHDRWVPPIHMTIADRGVGVSELADSIEKHYEYQKKSGELIKRRTSRVQIELEEILLSEIRKLLRKKFDYSEMLRKIVEYKKDPYTVAEEIISAL